MPRPRTIVEEFDPARVRPLPDQPRKRFRGIKELADSIFEVGQQTPGIVTPVSDDPKFDAQLIDGERRLRACRMAGVPFRAEVRAAATVEQSFVLSFAANFGKQDHDCIEIAEGLARMHRAGKTYEQLARIAGRSTQWVSAHMNLLSLHPDVRAMMIKEESRRDDESAPLTFALAQLLVPMAQERQLAAARKIVNWNLSMAEARRYILKQRAKAGDRSAYVSKRGVQRSIETIGSILSDATNRFGVFLDMPGPDFNALVDAADTRATARLVEQIESVCEELSGLAEVIRGRLNARRPAVDNRQSTIGNRA